MSKSGIVFICIFGLVIFLFAGCASDDNKGAGDSLQIAGQSGTSAGGASGASGGGVDPQATVTPSTTPTPSATPTPTTDTTSDPVCGNNIIEGDEQCDGIVPATTTCQSLNMGNSGTLTCTAECIIDTGLCFNQDADSGAPDGYVGI